MTFVSTEAKIRICGDVAVVGKDKKNNIRGGEYATFRKENGYTLTIYEGQWFDLKDYIQRASDEIGNKGRVGPNEKAIMRKYTEQAIEDIKSGKLKPISFSSFDT